MADTTRPLLCGVDVSQQHLDIACSDNQQHQLLNEVSTIEPWLRSLPPGSSLALEATSDYHEELLECAVEMGHQVYLINGKQLHHYREAVNQRAKTDLADARLLLRFLSHEHAALEPVKPLKKREKKLWRLLKRRACLVKVRKQVCSSLQGLPETEEMAEKLARQLNQAIKQLEKQMLQLARSLQWQQALKHCQSIPGVGLLNALGLVASFHRGQFRNADQFVAFLGLDVRVRDSGKYRGKRKLTKRGDAEMRRLLHNAAMSFARNPTYRPLYDRLLGQGKSAIAAYVVLARKLARIAFSLLTQEQDFDQEKFKRACMAT